MKRRYPDGPRLNLPLVVMAQMLPALFPSDPLAFGLGIARQFGDIAHYRLGPLHVYQLNSPELIRQVLVEQAEKFHKPRVLKRALRPIAGDGLLTSDGEAWRQQRKLMQPAFHHRQLEAYADVMVELATRMVESFVDGEVRNIGDEMAKLTLAVVVKSLFGSDLPFDAGELRQSILAALDAANQRMNAALPVPSWAPTRRNLRLRRALRRQEAMLRILVEARRASGESRNDLLSALLAAVDEDSGARMSDRQLRDEMMTLFGAGQETTATLLTWTWYLLSRHPEVEAKLTEELDLVLAGRTPVMADLAKLPYAEMVLREALRLYPPAPMFGREPIEDVSIGGYDVPKGSLIVVNTYALQRDARFFEDPEGYHPERFASGWEARIPRYAYLPFGGGPRVCIGNAFAMMEARLVLATVAQRYKLSLDSPGEIAPVQLVTLRPGRPVRVRLEKRRAALAVPLIDKALARRGGRMADTQALIAQAYSAFNRRDIDGALAVMSENVDWPKASEGGRVAGKEEIRAYWTRQWAEFNPLVEPIEVTDNEAGRTEVKVHQLVKNLSGDILSDQTLLHVFTIANGLIERMDIGESEPAFGQDHAG